VFYVIQKLIFNLFSIFF